MKKNIAYILVFIICFQITGCSQGTKVKELPAKERQAVQDDGNDYIAEEIALPEYAWINELAVQGNTLYYDAYYYENSDEASVTGALFRMDITEEQSDPVVIPYEIGNKESILKIFPNADGTLDLLVGEFEGTDANITMTELFWKKVDQNGQQFFAVPLIHYFEHRETIYPTAFTLDQKGRAFITMNEEVFVLDASGDMLFRVELDGYANNICSSSEGQVYVVWYGSLGTTIAKVDTETRELGTQHQIQQVRLPLGTAAGGAGDILLASDSGVYEYDTQSRTCQEKFQWTSFEMYADYSGKLLPLADGSVLWMSREYPETGMKYELTLIRPKKKGEQVKPEKKTLIFGGMSTAIDNSLKKTIIQYSKSNPDYRIEIKEYGEGDYEAGNTLLNADIISGKCPDILLLPVRFSMDLYARKGILENLYPYMDEDETCRRSDFQENILGAYEVDGGLYGIPLNYRILTVAGSKALLGDRGSWNLDEMIMFAEDFMWQGGVFEEPSQVRVMELCLMANGDCLVDWAAGEDGFRRDLFIQMLNFADQFDHYPYDNDLAGRIQEEDMQLLPINIQSVGDYQANCALFGERVSFPGYPSENGNGSLIDSGVVVAVSSNCADKEAAWELISSMLSEEFQSKPDLYRFPIRKSSLEKQFKRAMEAAYETDENGNKKEIPKGTQYIDSFETDIYAATEEDVRAVRNLVENADKIRIWDGQITQIAMAEVQAFFSGVKTAEEVADIVENRIRIYIEEMK